MVMLEELLVCGINVVEYDVYFINIVDGDQFGSGFVDVNFNFKILVLVDYSVNFLVWVFEFGLILFYLVDKFEVFIFVFIVGCIECFNWLFW